MSEYESGKLAEKILLLERFDLRENGLLSPALLTDLVDATPDEISLAIKEFESRALLAQIHPPNVKEVYFEPTPAGWLEREQLLRKRGLRHPALIVSPTDLPALVVALLMAGHVENDRLKRGMLGREPKLTAEELEFYVPLASRTDLNDAILSGISTGLIRRDQKLHRAPGSCSHHHVEALAVTERGRTMSSSILDLRIVDEIVIFNSWQSEYNASRSAIGKALEQVVAELNSSEGLFRPLRIVQATQPGDGAARIDVELLNRIKAAHFFVGDLTPVFAYDNRLCPNDNVLVEVGYAIASKSPEQIILVSKKRPDLEQGGNRLAFDIAHIRRHSFDGSSTLKSRLRTELEAALRAKGWLS